MARMGEALQRSAIGRAVLPAAGFIRRHVAPVFGWVISVAVLVSGLCELEQAVVAHDKHGALLEWALAASLLMIVALFVHIYRMERRSRPSTQADSPQVSALRALLSDGRLLATRIPDAEHRKRLQRGELPDDVGKDFKDWEAAVIAALSHDRVNHKHFTSSVPRNMWSDEAQLCDDIDFRVRVLGAIVDNLSR